MLSSIFGLKFALKAPRAAYRHGWGTAGLQSKPVNAMWSPTIFDVNKNTTTFPFDLVEGDMPLLTGLD